MIRVSKRRLRQKSNLRKSIRPMKFCQIRSRDRRTISRISLTKVKRWIARRTKTLPASRITLWLERRQTSIILSGLTIRNLNGIILTMVLIGAVNISTLRETTIWVIQCHHTAGKPMTSPITIDLTSTCCFSESLNSTWHTNTTEIWCSNNKKWKFYKVHLRLNKMEATICYSHLHQALKMILMIRM